MDAARPKNAKNLLTLKQAAEKLAVSPDVLLNLNEYNILKPTITLSGEIGYTEEQIRNFLTIQQVSSKGALKDFNDGQSVQKNPSVSTIPTAMPSVSFHTPLPAVTLLEQEHNEDTAPFALSAYKKHTVSFLAISSFSFLFFSAVFITLTGSDLSSSTSDPALSDASSTPIQFQQNTSGQDAAGNTLATDALQEKLALQDVIFENDTDSTSNDTSAEQLVDSSAPNPTNESAGMNFTGFAQRSGTTDTAITETSIFDEHGNLKGEPEGGDLLATTPLGQSSFDQADTSGKQVVNPFIWLAFLAVGFLTTMYVVKNRFVYLGARKTANDKEIYNTPQATKKVMEVTQKTDGTVVMFFKGSEYKISKPELDSESDQFIGRLMELVADGTKEIDYDTLQDDTIRFNTPLSKLVTRLGFVGVKRDLFFPRTSKTKVLFRRYLTEDDLNAMSLPIDKVSSSL